MYKILLTLLIAALAGSPGFAQGLFLGPRAGMNMASQHASFGTPVTPLFSNSAFFNENESARTGLLLGCVLNIGITDAISVQPELLYSEQGYQLRGIAVIGNQSFEIDNELEGLYYQVPVLAKYAYGQGFVRPFVVAGPYFGYWKKGVESAATTTRIGDGIASNNTGTHTIAFDKEIDEQNLFMAYAFNRYDFGVAVGGGIGLDLRTCTATLDARYNLGFANTLRPSPADNNFKLANRVFSLSIGLLFSLS